MRIKVPAFAVLFTLLALVLGFQNCGKGFQAATSFSSAHSSGGGDLANGMSKPALILPKSPAHNPTDPNSTEDLFTSFDDLLSPANLTGLKSASHLTNGRFAISVDTTFPTQIANPSDSLLYANSDPRFRQVNSYYHLHKYLLALEAAGVSLETYPKLTFDANCSTGLGKGFPFQNNAYYSQTDHYVCMGHSTVGGQKAWSSLDADVTVHEFTHSLNHHIAGVNLMASSMDAEALDEGLSDALAYLQNEQDYLARWFGRAIYLASGFNVLPFYGLRNLASNLQFPRDRVLTRHDDGRFASTVVRELFRTGVTKKQLQLGIFRTLEGIDESTLTFSNFFRDLRADLITQGVAPAVIEAAYTKYGLFRKDQMTQLSLDSTKPYYVIDNHVFTGFSKGGNCDGALDIGERAVLFMNFRNTGAELGTFTASIKPVGTQNVVKIAQGGNVGTYLGIKSNSTYPISYLPTDKTTNEYLTLLIYPAFAIDVLATAPAGNYDFTVDVMGFNSVDSTQSTKQFTITLEVGSDPNVAGNCAGTKESDVMP